jgi:hypothetical protein
MTMGGGFMTQARHLVPTATLAFALLATTGPALAFDDATYDGRFAAEYYKAGQLRTLSILPFAGPDGDNFTTVLASTLAQATLSGENWFTIKPASTKETDPIAAGKALGVPGIVSGTVLGAKLTRTDRVEAADKKAKDGAETKCTRIILQYSVRTQIHDVANGSVAYDKTHSAQDGYDLCNGKAQPIPVETNEGFAVKLANAIAGGPKKDVYSVEFTEDALFQRVRSVIATRIKDDIAPANRPVSVEFKRRAPELPKPMQLTFESATPFVKAKQLDRACAIWLQMRGDPAADASVSLLYNLGACQEAQKPDNPIAALELYVKADQLLSKPDKLLTPALKRAQTMVENQQKIGS